MSLFAELLREYLEQRKALNMSRGTLRANASQIGIFIRWLKDKYGIIKSEELRSLHIKEYQKHLALKRTTKGHLLLPRSINKAVECVRTFLARLGRDGHLPAKLFESMDYVKVPDLLPRSVLVHDQVRALINAVDESSPAGYRDRAILELMYTNGIRASELLGLELGSLDFHNGTATIFGKGMKERVVPVGQTALRYLETYIAIVRPYALKNPEIKSVFLNTDGGPLTYVVLRKIVRKYAAKAGLPDYVTPHTLRRSCTTELLRGGAGMYHVKELLGHTSLDTLKHYARLTISDLRKTHAQCHPRERENNEEQVDLKSAEGKGIKEGLGTDEKPFER